MFHQTTADLVRDEAVKYVHKLADQISKSCVNRADDSERQTLGRCSTALANAANCLHGHLTGLIITKGVDEPLALDSDQARALHRVVRAMHDGECPKCHAIHSSDEMRCADGGWRCPSCRFFILKSEADAVLATFGEFMERSCAIFEEWRDKRKQPALQE